MERTGYREHYREGDYRAGGTDQDGHIALEPLIGTWINTRTDTKGFVKVTIVERSGSLFLRAFGACEPRLSDWGEIEASVFSADVSSHGAKGLSAVYDTDAIEVAIQANLNLGLLVLLTFNRFKDGSRRTNYICREFFYRKSKTVDY